MWRRGRGQLQLGVEVVDRAEEDEEEEEVKVVGEGSEFDV